MLRRLSASGLASLLFPEPLATSRLPVELSESSIRPPLTAVSDNSSFANSSAYRRAPRRLGERLQVACALVGVLGFDLSLLSFVSSRDTDVSDRDSNQDQNPSPTHQQINENHSEAVVRFGSKS